MGYLKKGTYEKFEQASIEMIKQDNSKINISERLNQSHDNVMKVRASSE